MSERAGTVQGDDQGGHRRGDGRRRRPVDERAHHVAAAGEEHQRHERERDPERQHDLRDDQGARRVEPDGEHDERRRHGHQPARHERDGAVDEALHDDLTGIGADARRREPGGQQGEREGQRRRRADEVAEAGVRPLDRVHVRQPRLVEERRGDHQHRQVDDPGDAHRDPDVDALEPQQPALLVIRPGRDPALGERRVQVDHVRHDRRAEDPSGEQQGVGAREAGDEPARDARRVVVDHQRVDEEADEDHPDRTTRPTSRCGA